MNLTKEQLGKDVRHTLLGSLFKLWSFQARFEPPLADYQNISIVGLIVWPIAICRQAIQGEYDSN
jgi:hypothetical protein